MITPLLPGREKLIQKGNFLQLFHTHVHGVKIIDIINVMFTYICRCIIDGICCLNNTAAMFSWRVLIILTPDNKRASDLRRYLHVARSLIFTALCIVVFTYFHWKLSIISHCCYECSIKNIIIGFNTILNEANPWELFPKYTMTMFNLPHYFS